MRRERPWRGLRIKPCDCSADQKQDAEGAHDRRSRGEIESLQPNREEEPRETGHERDHPPDSQPGPDLGGEKRAADRGYDEVRENQIDPSDPDETSDDHAEGPVEDEVPETQADLLLDRGLLVEGDHEELLP